MLIIVSIAAAVLLVTQIITIIAIGRKNSSISKLKKLYDIGRKITSNIKINHLMKEIMEIAKTETGAEACSLYLVDEEKQELYFEAALGGKDEKAGEIRVRIGEGV